MELGVRADDGVEEAELVAEGGSEDEDTPSGVVLGSLHNEFDESLRSLRAELKPLLLLVRLETAPLLAFSVALSFEFKSFSLSNIELLLLLMALVGWLPFVGMDPPDGLVAPCRNVTPLALLPDLSGRCDTDEVEDVEEGLD